MAEDLSIILQTKIDEKQSEKTINDQLNKLAGKLDKLDLNIDINNKSVNAFTKSMKQAKDSTRDITSEIKQVGTATKKLNDNMKFVGFDQLKKHVEDVKSSVGKVSRVIVNTEEDTNKLKKATVEYKNDVGKLVREVLKLENAQEQVGDELKDIQVLRSQGKTFVDDLQKEEQQLRKNQLRLQNYGQEIRKLNQEDLNGRDLKKIIENLHDQNVEVKKLQQRWIGLDEAVWDYTYTVQTGKDEFKSYTGVIDEGTKSLRRHASVAEKTLSRDLDLISQFKIALERVPIWLGATTAIFGSLAALQSMLSTIIQIDTQMTELKRVMDAPSDAYNQMLQEAINLSNELGNNINDVNAAMIGFARQGFTQDQVMDLTKTAIVASNVSELTADEAMSNITSAMVQFNVTASDSIRIVDKLNEVILLSAS